MIQIIKYVAIITTHIKIISLIFSVLERSISEILKNISAGRETLKTNLDVTATKLSEIILSFFKINPRAIIKNTGVTIPAVNKIFCSIF